MRQHFPARAGFTLVEVLVFVSVSSVLFLLGIQLIHLSMRISQSAKEQWQQDATLSRLTHDFRQDIRQASVFEFVSSTEFRMEIEGNAAVDWQLDKQRLRRSCQVAELPAIEDYTIPNDYQAKLSYDSLAKLVRLTVSRSNELGESTTRIERLVEIPLSDDTQIKGLQPTTATTSDGLTPAKVDTQVPAIPNTEGAQ